MTKWALSLALVSGLGLVAAVPAEASHRHSRSGRHGSYDRYEDRRPVYRNDRHYDDYSYAPRYDGRYYDSYAPRYYGPTHYDQYYDGAGADYYYAPPPPRVVVHYHGRLRCTRNHFSLRFGY